jgi:hypothetical protein
MHSPDHSTKGTPSAPGPPGTNPRRPHGAFDCLEVTGFRHSFIPLAGCFSPFPHGTRALSVARRNTALEGGPPSFPQDFACPAVLRVTADPPRPRRRLRGFHPLWRGVPATSAGAVRVDLDWACACSCRALQPRQAPCGTRRFGLRPFRSPLLRASLDAAPVARTLRRLLISLPRGTEMFQFPRCPACGLCIQPPLSRLAARRVAPFGFGWLIARLQLPTHVSPLSASFFGTWPLGIPPSPFSAWR